VSLGPHHHQVGALVRLCCTGTLLQALQKSRQSTWVSWQLNLRPPWKLGQRCMRCCLLTGQCAS
jgi:hypothetical protein